MTTMYKLKKYSQDIGSKIAIYGNIARCGDVEFFTIAREELFMKFWFCQYTRLYGKYEQALEKIKELRQLTASDTEHAQKDYLDELANIKASYKRDMRSAEEESKKLKQSLEELYSRRQNNTTTTDKNNTLSDVENLKDDLPAIVEALSKEGIEVENESSGKQVLADLFKEYKRIFNRLKHNNIGFTHSDEEYKELQRELRSEKTKNEKNTKQLQEKDDSIGILKGQIDTLLKEQKEKHLQMQSLHDESESSKEGIDDIKAKLKKSRETLSKQTAKLNVTEEDLTRVTDELHVTEAEHERTKRQIAVKDAEIVRLKQDLENESDRLNKEIERVKKLQELLKQKERSNVDGDDHVFTLELKVKELEKELHTFHQENERLVSELDETLQSRDDLQNDLNERKTKFSKQDTTIKTLQTKNEELSRDLEEKRNSFMELSQKLDETSTELLTTKDLLMEKDEEVKQGQLQLSQISEELTLNDTLKNPENNDELQLLRERNKKILADAQERENRVRQEAKLRESELEEKIKRESILREELHERCIELEKQLKEQQNQFTEVELPSISQRKEGVREDRIMVEEEPLVEAQRDGDLFAANDNSGGGDFMNDDLDWLMENTPLSTNPVKDGTQSANQKRIHGVMNDLKKEKDGIQQKLKIKEKELQKVQQNFDEKEQEIQRMKNEMIRMTDQQKLASEKAGEEKEAVECLRSLVADNEAYVKCIAEQQSIINSLKSDNFEISRRMNDTLHSLEAECDTSLRMKAKLKNVMEISLTRESDKNFLQRQEIETLKKQLEDIRTERQQLKLDLEDKVYELDKTQNDLTSLKSVVEYNLGSIDAEKRSKDFVEEQLKLVIQDRGHTLQKLRSLELANQVLQNKLRDLQKWHNQMEFQLFKSRDHYQPMTPSPENVDSNEL
ncbi:interaptin-like isoform X2 [Clytia hemisphaerica]|uniref:interaptin-like isoform X2 n=1 Tax=Clytia hemisphaerica TaxID=252671 RepID=UPI0034D7598E